VENGRLFKLLCKLGTINERPELVELVIIGFFSINLLKLRYLLNSDVQTTVKTRNLSKAHETRESL